MNRVWLTLLLIITSLGAAQAALPGDSAEGKKLHEANCLKCHNADVYTRKNRHIGSLPALQEQLGACSHAAQVLLTDDEQRDIVKYLNETFYKFK
jgi:mono/diheme cytochrome c family protein